MIISIKQIGLISLISMIFSLVVGKAPLYSLETSIVSSKWQNPITQSALYNPLTIPDHDFKTVELVVNDSQRERSLPILVYLPASSSPRPVILFSHGLGGSRYGSSYLGKHWAARGYVVVFVQHPGSDRAVWKNKPRRLRIRAFREAANRQNYLLRVQDIPTVLDQLQVWNQQKEHSLAGRMNLDKIGMSGHSFGALTTQAVSGQSIRGNDAKFRDSRIEAAIMFSPNAPNYTSPEDAFGTVEIPWMLITGTKDISPIGSADLDSRLAVFPALPSGNKYELVLADADHFAFIDRALQRTSPNSNHHRAILALSTAFWDAWLKNDRIAQAWLESDQPRSVLEEGDRWQTK